MRMHIEKTRTWWKNQTGGNYTGKQLYQENAISKSDYNI